MPVACLQGRESPRSCVPKVTENQTKLLQMGLSLRPWSWCIPRGNAGQRALLPGVEPGAGSGSGVRSDAEEVLLPVGCRVPGARCEVQGGASQKV